ncbi:hypothetical protein HOY80DRAFT_993699 [Tuber brumale]|nr:hypothetical protein HOY80DRAFT_993699 [Tuber brumale]
MSFSKRLLPPVLLGLFPLLLYRARQVVSRVPVPVSAGIDPGRRSNTVPKYCTVLPILPPGDYYIEYFLPAASTVGGSGGYILYWHFDTHRPFTRARYCYLYPNPCYRVPVLLPCLDKSRTGFV